ncbi:MAG: 50S ribosomal protein L9 [Fimbriimonadaceae bacterium]
MKVIMTTTVPKVGKEGTVVNVADGFARNYLFPRGLATLADKKQLAALEKRRARLAAKEADTKAAAEAIKEKLDGKTVKIEGNVGKELGRLFGAVTAQNVADAIKAQLGVTLEKKQVALVEPIKRLGMHDVLLDLHREVDATVVVHVFDPNAPVEEPAAEEAPETDADEPAVEEEEPAAV